MEPNSRHLGKAELQRLSKLTVILLITASVAAFLISSLSAAEADHSEAITVLSRLGVLKGYNDGELHENDPVERYQMALLISRLMTGRLDDAYWNVPLDDSVPFVDVRSDYTSKYCGAVNLCYENNIILGKDETHFAPHDGIKYKEALAMICRAAGLFYYDYPSGYINAASRIGLCEDMGSIAYGDILTRGQTAQLLYNLLKILSGIIEGDGSFSYTGRTYFKDFKDLNIKDVRTKTGFRTEYSMNGSVFWEYDCEETDDRPDVFYSYADYKKNTHVDPKDYYLAAVYSFRLHDGTVAGLVDIPVYESGEIVYSGGARTVVLDTVTGRVSSVGSDRINLEDSKVSSLKTGFTGCASVPKISVKTGETYTFYVCDGYAVDIKSHRTESEDKTDTAVIVSTDGDTATALLLSDGFSITREIELPKDMGVSRVPAAVTLEYHGDAIYALTESDTYRGCFIYEDGVFTADISSVKYDIVDGVPVRTDDGSIVDRTFFTLRANGDVTPKSYHVGKNITYINISGGSVDIVTDAPEDGDIIDGEFVYSTVAENGYCIVYTDGELFRRPDTDGACCYVRVPDGLSYAYEDNEDGTFSFYIGGIEDLASGDELDVCLSPVSDSDIDVLIGKIKDWNRRIYGEFVYRFEHEALDFSFTCIDYSDALTESGMHEASVTLTYDELRKDALAFLLDAYNSDTGSSFTDSEIARVSFSGDKLTEGFVYAVGIDLDRGAMAFSATLYAVGVTVDSVTYNVNGIEYACSLEAVMDGYPEIEDEFRESGYIPFGAVLRASGLESDNAVDGDVTATITVGGREFTLLLSGGSIRRDHVDAQEGETGAPGSGVITIDSLDRELEVHDGGVTFDTLSGDTSGENSAYLYWRGHESMTMSRTAVLAEFTPERIDDGSGDGFDKCAASFTLAADVYSKGDAVEIYTLAIDWDTEPVFNTFYGEVPQSTLAYDSDGVIIFGDWYFYGSVDTDTRSVRVATYEDYLEELEKCESDDTYIPSVRPVKLRVAPCVFAPLYVSSDADEDGERVNVAFLRTTDKNGNEIKYGEKKMYSPLDALFTANVILNGGSPSIPAVPGVDGSDFVPATSTFRFTYSRNKLTVSVATPRVW